jgi:hypothetical protein
MSTRATSPSTVFDKGSRLKQRQLYSKDGITEVRPIGPGPKYVVKENKRFRSSPRFGFGGDNRFHEKKAPYQHYEVLDTSTNSSLADLSRKTHYGTTKFGSESREASPS